jgi:mannitol-1-phosphate/altronate dehydrogenase
LLKSANGAREQARSLLSLSSIFPSRLSADAQFLNLVAEHLDKLQRIGARATVQQFVLEPTGTA